MKKIQLGELIKEKKHKDGTVTFELKCSTKQKNELYKAALILVNEKKIGVKDFLYQVKHVPNALFKDVVIGAFVYWCFSNYCKKGKYKKNG